jgi:hypothetical protein
MLKKLGAKSAFLLFAAAAGAFSFAPVTQATPVHYDFTVHITTSNSNAFKDSTASGTFSYDSSSIVVGGHNDATNLLTAFDFIFNGIAYDTATVNTGRLTFDSSGVLTAFMFGTHCTAGACVMPRSDAFLISSTSFTFFLRTPGTAAGTGTTSYSLAPLSVPEPGTLGLFGLGALMLGLFAATRRRIG